MNDGSLSFMARVRAVLASLLAGLAGGARRLEQWSARGTRPIVLGLVAIAVLGVGAFAIVAGTHAFGRWLNPRPHPAETREFHFRGPAPKPHGKPSGEWGGWFEGRRGERPDRPVPPAPPVPPVPPAPPVGATQP
jgi:hypothetical protein